MTRALVSVAIALGSNLGDRERNLREAIASLAPILSDLSVSTFRETSPVGVGDQASFLNAAATGRTDLPPDQLLAALLEIEHRLGRERPYPGAPRTLDLDLILYGDAEIAQSSLTVPHPRFRQRQFVLEPLAEIAANWVDPTSGQTVGELLTLCISRR